MRKLLTLCLTLITGAAALPAEDAQTLFDDGVRAYTKAEQADDAQAAQEFFSDAVQDWKLALEQSHSPALHYNLGNAYAQLHQPGKAILHYEKAIALEPRHAEAIANLNYVREQQKLPPIATYEAFHHAFSVDTWTWTAAAAFWCFVAAILLPRLFARPTVLTRLAALFTCAVIGVCGYALLRHHLERTEGVVLSDEAPLHIAPSPESEIRGYTQAGIRAQYSQRHGDFYLVHTENNTSGWITQSDYAPIWSIE